MAITIQSYDPMRQVAYGITQFDAVDAPSDAKWRVRERLGKLTEIFLRYDTGRMERWVAAIKTVDGKRLLYPFIIQDANTKGL